MQNANTQPRTKSAHKSKSKPTIKSQPPSADPLAGIFDGVTSVSEDPSVISIARELRRRQDELKQVIADMNGARDEPQLSPVRISGDEDVEHLMAGADIATLSALPSHEGRRTTLRRQREALDATILQLQSRLDAATLVASEKIVAAVEDRAKSIVRDIVANSDALQASLAALHACYVRLAGLGVASVLLCSGRFCLSPFEHGALFGGRTGSLSSNKRRLLDNWGIKE